ncbi:MAG: hypothetical protein V7637_4537 [Mycobacteriales bacterium]
MRTGVAVTAGWLAAAAAASAVSWSAVRLANSAVPAAQPARQVATQSGTDVLGPAGGTTSPQPAAGRAGPAATTGGRPTVSGTPRHSPAATATDPVRASGTGGSVTFHCSGTSAVYQNVIPQVGYSSHQDDSGSGEVRFESSTHRTDLVISCPGGAPHWTRDERDLGGGGGGGGGDGGGGGKGSGGSGSGKGGSSGQD